MNKRNFFDGGVTGIAPKELYGAKVDHLSLAKALNEGAKENSVQQKLYAPLPSTGHDFDPLLRVLIGLHGSQIDLVLLSLRNMGLPHNSHYATISINDPFALRKTRNANGKKELEENRKARLIYLLVPNPPTWIKQTNGTFEIVDEFYLVTHNTDDDIGEDKNEHRLKQAIQVLSSPYATPRKRKREDSSPLITDPRPLNFYSPNLPEIDLDDALEAFVKMTPEKKA